jgi:hypothetical protein
MFYSCEVDLKPREFVSVKSKNYCMDYVTESRFVLETPLRTGFQPRGVRAEFHCRCGC